MKKTLAVIGAAALLAFPMIASAQGLVGDCADCHTMHNSEQGAPVAMKGFATEASATPNQNLLKFDCIACHAKGGNAKIADVNGSQIPQVYHTDTSDLAAGNFMHIVTAGNDQAAGRKGHNVRDLLLAAQTDNVNSKVDSSGNPSAYAVPPGQYYGYQDGHGYHLSTDRAAGFDKFTCAGAGGCHGTRSNFMEATGATVEYTCTAEDVTGVTRYGTYYPNHYSCDGLTEGTVVQITDGGKPRTGIAAVSGAHHQNYDGAKDAAAVVGGHSGQAVADSYRFLLGLKGYGNEAARWQNVDGGSHNEYFGAAVGFDTANSCNSCHVTGAAAINKEYFMNGGKYYKTSSRMTTDSTLKVPNQSMSGFCITCHGNFHSSSLEVTGSNGQDRAPNNGSSGAFLRHPSDYVIPDDGREYADYTAYNITAPVARPTLYTAAEETVTPGTDMVMCLSCHQAHATEFDGMLRFDYSTMIAGNSTSTDGCLACHTTKGVSKQPATTTP